MSGPLDPALLALLRRVDTPTVCNAIEVAQGARGFANFTRATMQHSAAFSGGGGGAGGAPPMVGFARTARIAGLVAPSDANEVLRARRMAYFRAMAEGEGPRLAVIEDLDGADAIAGWWGEVHVAVHRGLGLSGAVTNGVMRDLGASRDDFPVLAGSVGPSHGFVHVVDIGGPVEIFGMQVADGDLVHADCHGALVVPRAVWGGLAAAIAKVAEAEAIILGPAGEPGFGIARLEEVWPLFEAART